MKNENIERIEKIERLANENKLFLKTDDAKDINEEIKWIAEYAKKQTKKVEFLKEAFDRKTEVHDKLNKDYVEMKYGYKKANQDSINLSWTMNLDRMGQ